MSAVCVRAPATTANLGAGFDSLGLALRLYNRVSVEETESGLEIEVSGEGADALPRDSSNVALAAMRRLFESVGRALPPLRIRLQNAIPLARGLGSSSAAIVAGLVAANALAGDPLSAGELVDMAAALDGHPDNVTACLVGGLAVTAMEGMHIHYARVPVSEALQVALYIPDFQVSTPAARRHLPDVYTREEAVFALSRAALTVGALATGQWELLRVGMQDCMHQPYRSGLYPQMSGLVAAALEAGAFGAALSGSGPTIAAITDGDPVPVARAMEEVGSACELTGRTVCVRVDGEGACVV